MMNRFVPNPALLKQRLELTGKEWQLGRYVAVSLGIAMLTALAATAGGVPLILAIMLGLLVGIALPHKAVSILIQKRISRFTAIFPDAIDLLVRGLRSGLPISESLGIVSRELPDPVDRKSTRLNSSH